MSTEAEARAALEDYDHSPTSLRIALDAYRDAILAAERERYEALDSAIEHAWSRFGEGSMMGSQMSRTERLAVLVEEVGEVAAEVVKEQRNRSAEPGKHGPFDVAALVAELTQVAACAVMWARHEEGVSE